MNRKILLEYIAEYKKQFVKINRQEIYKWKAVKCFQENWNIEEGNFYEMIDKSFRQTKNLLDSGKAYPFAVLLEYTEQRPEKIRTMFKQLFDEEKSLYDRINNFRNEINIINQELNPTKNSYQDQRAILVYLSLKFPDRYFLYKFSMFEDVSLKLGYHFHPIKGRNENLGHYLSFCELIRYELLHDQELLKIHKNRIEDDCYYDEHLNLLTQDFIYAINKYLNIEVHPEPKDSSKVNIIELSSKEVTNTIIPSNIPSNFNGKIVNFIQNNVENKRIGDLGEIWVIKQEKIKLNELNKSHLIAKIKHISKEEGDGTGYDIESVDEEGNKIYIEVKTSKGGEKTPFYISKRELERSQMEKESYYLYRIYNFNVETDTAELLIIKGELTNLCTYPTEFQVKL